jgi:GT2 family glycosyltransferase
MGPGSHYHQSAPRVSVITPAYNAALYIEHTLDSAIRQTFTDFELLIVDDGSTDQTRQIAEQYAKRDARVRVIHQPNRGIAAARNAALVRARGQYLALLDSDDLWFPSYLEEQLAILTHHPNLAILSANALNFGGPLDGEPLLGETADSGLRMVSLLRLVEVEDSMSIQAIFRRDVAAQIGAFDENLRRSEDYDFWLRAAHAGFQIAVNPKPLGLYRRRPDSLSAEEAVMLDAMRRPLVKLRDRCGDQPDLLAAIERQLARVSERGLVARARSALVSGDMSELVTHFSALAKETGAQRYRVARWLTGHAPITIRLAYRCKRQLGRLVRSGRRAYGPIRSFGAGGGV